MAYLDQLTDEERRQLEQSAPASAGSGAATVGAPSSAPPSSGFQNLANYFNANKDAAGALAGSSVESLRGEAESALRSDSPSQAMSTLGDINAAANPNSSSQRFEVGGASPGEARFDAYLAGRGGGTTGFEGLRETYGSRLPKVETPMTQPTAPTAPVRAPGGGSVAGTLGSLAQYTKDTAAYPGQVEDYNKSRDSYNAWAQRRAENIAGRPGAPVENYAMPAGPGPLPTYSMGHEEEYAQAVQDYIRRQKEYEKALREAGRAKEGR